MKDQSFTGEVGIVTGQEININHAHFHTPASPRLLLIACLVLSFALGVVTGRDCFPVRNQIEGTAMIADEKADSLALTASSAV